MIGGEKEFILRRILFFLVPEGKPLSLTTTADSSSSIGLSWAEPQESLRNGIITEYKIIYSANQSNQSFSPVMTPGTSQQIVGLTPFSSYCFDVAARTNYTPVSGDAFGPSARACETTQQDSKCLVTFLEMIFKSLSFRTFLANQCCDFADREYDYCEVERADYKERNHIALQYLLSLTRWRERDGAVSQRQSN